MSGAWRLDDVCLEEEKSAMVVVESGHQKVYKSADHAEISTFGRLQHVKHVKHTSNTAQ